MSRFGILAGFVFVTSWIATHAEMVPESMQGIGDFTFLAWTDSHFTGFYKGGFHDDTVNDMNGIAGSEMPHGLGIVPPVAFVLHAGDVTNRGIQDQWDNNYPSTDTAFLPCISRLNYPVYEVRGNHDEDNNQMWVADGIRARHGELYYSFDYGGLHFVGLDCPKNVPPSDSPMWQWLRDDLSSVGTTVPIVIWQHHLYTVDAYWNPLREAIAGRNVVLLINGHTHGYNAYTWEGRQCWDAGHNVLCENTWNDQKSGFTVFTVQGNWLRGAHYFTCENTFATDRWVDVYMTGRVIPTPVPHGDPVTVILH